jgi:hypothetical protein
VRRDRQLVIEFLGAYNCVHGSSFSVEFWPEEEQRNAPAVEALAPDGDRLMAVEHTLAQLFVGERRDSAIFRRVLGPIEADESLHQRGYDITVSIDVGAIPTGVDWDGSGSIIRSWLKREIPKIPEGTSSHIVPGLDFELEIFVEKIFDDTPGHPGSLFVSRNAPTDTLPEVLETALRQKLPKLSATPADIRILLLERADFLGGYHRFGSALRQLLTGEFAELKPDEIWLVNTVALERENVLFFYKIWPAYLEYRVRRGKDGVFQRLDHN